MCSAMWLLMQIAPYLASTSVMSLRTYIYTMVLFYIPTHVPVEGEISGHASIDNMCILTLLLLGSLVLIVHKLDPQHRQASRFKIHDWLLANNIFHGTRWAGKENWSVLLAPVIIVKSFMPLRVCVLLQRKREQAEHIISLQLWGQNTQLFFFFGKMIIYKTNISDCISHQK